MKKYSMKEVRGVISELYKDKHITISEYLIMRMFFKFKRAKTAEVIKKNIGGLITPLHSRNIKIRLLVLIKLKVLEKLPLFEE